MAKTAQAKKETKAPDKSNKIREAYITYVLTNGKEPPSVFLFMKELSMREDAFYEHFGSFTALEKNIWKSYFDETHKRLMAEKTYLQYSSREKFLAFYFTLMEVLKSQRSFVQYSFKGNKRTEIAPGALRHFKEAFLEYAEEVLDHGVENKEVVRRRILSDRYKDGLWLQLLFVINFWLKDDSPGFENTDAAIEKAVNLSFDLMGKGLVDSIIDFGRFLYQNR